MILNILFTNKAHFARDGVNKTRNSHLWDRDNPHGTVGSNFQHLFAINVWCGVIGPYIFPQCLTGDIYASFLQDELPALLENVPLQTRRQMYYQHDGVPPHFSQVARQYLNHKFPERWIGHGGAQTWPPRSLDLNLLDYHVWGYMKKWCMHTWWTWEKNCSSEFSALWEVSTTLHCFVKVTSSLVTRVRKCIHADRGHFEQFAWVLNGESVTVRFNNTAQ